MQSIFLWIQQNPSAVKAYLAGILALIAKIIVALTGVAANLGPWTDIVNQLVDLIVGGLTIYSVLIGTLHVTRGPIPAQAAATPEAPIAQPGIKPDTKPISRVI